MAPKGGRGGGSSGGSSGGGSRTSSTSSGYSGACPGAFSSLGSTTLVFFIGYCIFSALMIIVFISLCCVRKRHSRSSTKQLLGPLYIAAVTFLLLSWLLTMIAAVLQECRVGPRSSSYGWAIAYSLFFRLGSYLLLFVTVWSVNSMLRERLGRKAKFDVYKIINIVAIALMGLLTVAYIVASSYQRSTVYRGGLTIREMNRLVLTLNKFWKAYMALWIVCVAVGFGLAMRSIFALKSKLRTSLSDLIFWISVLSFCMVIWPIFSLVSPTYTKKRSDIDAVYALYYLESLFQIFTFVPLLFLAKSPSWELAFVGRDGQAANDGQQNMGQQQYDANTYGNGGYQSQQPVVGGGGGLTHHYGYYDPNQQPIYAHNEMPAAPMKGYIR